MKIASGTLSLLILVVISIFFAGCKKDDENKKTEEQTQLEKLKGVWTIETANDGGDRTPDFTGTPGPMVLTLSGNYAEGGTYNYSITGDRPEPSPWPAEGTWKFGTNKLTELIRDPSTGNEIPMSYSVTDNNLIIEFTIPEGHQGWSGGRVSSVSGQWRFTFTK